ncbi:MAG TPA: ABC transporter substrate-binding protein [Candidatus Limnocylindrales bacterium]|nr:ABC transporter substrate-binding protein [Candidatus Limnocylindrales bacterium]
MNRRRFAATLAVGVLVLAGCSGTPSGSGAGAGGDTLLLGGIAGTTGAYGTTGQAVVNGTQVAVDEINAAGGILGKQVRFEWEDDGADPTKSSQLFSKYLSDGAIAIAGSPDTGPTTVELSTKNNFPIIGAVDDCGLTVYTEGPDKPPAPYAFCTSLNTFAYGGIIGQHALDNCEALAVLHDPSTYGMGGLYGIQSTYEATGRKIVLDESITENWSTGATVGLRAEIDKINDAGADCVDVWLTPQDQANFISEARSLGATFTVYGNDETNADTTFSDLAGDAADGYVAAEITTRLNPAQALLDFRKTYKDKFKVDATPFAELSYDAAKVLKDVAEKAKSTEPAKLQAEFNKVTDFPGLFGPLTFTEQRHATLDAEHLTIVVFDKGSKEWKPEG